MRAGQELSISSQAAAGLDTLDIAVAAPDILDTVAAGVDTRDTAAAEGSGTPDIAGRAGKDIADPEADMLRGESPPVEAYPCYVSS